MPKLNKSKINERANTVMAGFNGLKETLSLILLGAGLQDAAVKIIEQRFNSANEQFNNFINMLHQEIEASEKIKEEL
jgi:mannose/fructose/N-acetylgalactosamine-specific phosphotransferase system component IIB